MTIRSPSWLQAGSYPAESDRLLLQALLGGSPNQTPASGVVGAADLAVTASGTPDMNVHVAAGAAFIEGTETTTQGVYGFYNDASFTVGPLAASDPTNDRISLIVGQVLDAGYSGSSNDGQLVEVAGTPASSPVAPAVPKNSIVLAQVRVGHGVSSITAAAITDKRVFQGAEVNGASVYRSGAWTTGTSPSTFGFDTVEYDPSGLWVQASTEFVMKSPGRYLCEATASYVQGAANQWAWLEVIVNGATRLVSPPNASAVQLNPAGAQVVGVLNLAVGDTVALQHRYSANGLTGLTGVGASYMKIERLAKNS